MASRVNQDPAFAILTGVAKAADPLFLTSLTLFNSKSNLPEPFR